MAFIEHSRVRLTRALTADDGHVLEAGTTGTIVHVWHDGSGSAAYEVEVHVADPAVPLGRWHLATASADDLEPIGSSGDGPM